MKLFAFDRAQWRVLRRDEGATAIEFALIAPVLMSMVLMALQIGLALHKGNTVQWAINKAARAALLDTSLDEAAIQDYIDARIKTIDSNAAVEINYNVTTVGTAALGTISGTYYHEVEVPFFPSFTARFDIDVSVPRV
ncbi:MAG: pilus assembly protein [Hyphomonadaceae bacterium]|nr:pilus assembly protein [Hyphomonadaceae bacterium]